MVWQLLASPFMLPLLSGIQTVLPYLVALWLLPFLVIAIKMVRRPTVTRVEEFPYTKKPMLFSPAERLFLGVLEQAIGNDYRIFGKVQVADIVSVKPTADRSAWLGAFNPISAKNFDFVLCDKEHLSIRCVIDLNNTSHHLPQRQKQDTFVEGVCEALSLPFVQIQAPRQYSALELRKKILASLSGDTEAQTTEMTEFEPPFSVGLATDPRLDDRPWTLDESAILRGTPERMSDPQNFKAPSKLALDVER
jgi:hypothetical protein